MSKRAPKIRPKVISFLQEKGGSGKTTMSTNIARGLILREYDVLLVDADPQGSARDWNEKNSATLVPVVGLDRETIATDLKGVMSGYDFVIIDGAPQISRLSAAAVRASDLVLIPVQPSPYDIWASLNLVELIKGRREITDGSPDAAFIVSRVIKNTKLSNEVSEILCEYGIPVFKSFTSQLVVYPTTAAQGCSVFDCGPSAAQEEISKIIDEILERFA